MADPKLGQVEYNVWACGLVTQLNLGLWLPNSPSKSKCKDETWCELGGLPCDDSSSEHVVLK